VGDHFKVDIDQLDRFIKTLQQATKDLDDARKALSHVRAAEIGTSRLDEACDTFQERWKYGSEQLSEMIGSISEGVKANKLSYEEFEENLEKTLKQIAEVSTSSGGGKG
jgi:exonuclease VII small subunit